MMTPVEHAAAVLARCRSRGIPSFAHRRGGNLVGGWAFVESRRARQSFELSQRMPEAQLGPKRAKLCQEESSGRARVGRIAYSRIKFGLHSPAPRSGGGRPQGRPWHSVKVPAAAGKFSRRKKVCKFCTRRLTRSRNIATSACCRVLWPSAARLCPAGSPAYAPRTSAG